MMKKQKYKGDSLMGSEKDIAYSKYDYISNDTTDVYRIVATLLVESGEKCKIEDLRY